MSLLYQIIHLQNWDLLSVGLSMSAIVILAFVVFFNDRNSVTNRTFLLFAFLTVFYGACNYINYQVHTPELVLWFLRLTIFFAVWHAFSFFQLFYVFPNLKIKFPNWYKHILLPITAIVSILTLTPLVFKKIEQISEVGGVSNPDRGPAIVLFGLLTVFLVCGGVFNLIKKIRSSVGQAKKQFNSILLGTITTFTLIIFFNFVLPVVFNNLTFIPLAPVFMLPFIAYTAYSIIRYHLLNTKIIATEILVFLLVSGMLWEILLSDNLLIATFRFFIFVVVLVIGVLLIKSVTREVKQREQLQILTGQLEQANIQLKVLDQARADFITIASHQLRTPPATIKWYLSALKNGDYGQMDEGVKEVVVKAEATNNSLIALIDDLLNASRIERGKMEFVFEPVDLMPLVQLTVEQLRPLAEMKKLELLFDPPKKSLPKVVADKEKIRQVVNNFIDNAIKYTPAGSVRVFLDTDEESLIVRVVDTGKGFSSDNGAKLFEKYSRGTDAASHATGLGLGLYVAKVVVDQHKGKIWAKSEGEGKGAEFGFSLALKNDLPERSSLDFAGQTGI